MSPPARVTYTSADDRYSVYGWKVTMRRAGPEFSTLESANSCGFRLAGSGSATVVTPADFIPGSAYTLTLRGRNASGLQSVVAGSDGRLTVQVPLGPANPAQEYTVPALLAGTKIHTTSVTVGACSPPPPPPPCSVPRPFEIGSQVAVGPDDQCGTIAAVSLLGKAFSQSGPAISLFGHGAR